MSEAELTSLFKTASDPAIMAELQSMSRVYNLTPQDLWFKYEAFLLSRPSGLRAKLSIFTLDVARDLRKEIQREVQTKHVASTPTEKVAGVRKKAGGASGPLANDFGGFLDNLTTPRRPSVPSRLSNAGNNVNLPSPSFSTPSRTPTGPGPSASAYRPSTKLAPSVTPLGRSAAPTSPVSGGESPVG